MIAKLPFTPSHPHTITPSQNLEAVLANHTVCNDDCLRLAILYALRNESQGRADMDRIDRLLSHRGISEADRKVHVYYIILCSYVNVILSCT